MSVDQVLRLFAIGAIVCNAATVIWLAAALRRRIRPAEGMPSTKGPFGLRARAIAGGAAIAALAGTLGSLYLSEIAHLEPCRWCWFQRIAMYPLALVALIGWLRRDRGLHLYGIPMCLAGVAMSTWHYLLQHFPQVSDATSCDFANPCTLRYAWEFNFISIPYMAGSVFLLAGVLLNSTRGRW